jgi:hypothetical protein
MFSSKSLGKNKNNILPIVIGILFIVVTLPAVWKFVGNSLSAVGLPTEVKEVTDAYGNTCQNIPMLLQVVHAVVLALLVVVVLNWMSGKN